MLGKFQITNYASKQILCVPLCSKWKIYQWKIITLLAYFNTVTFNVYSVQVMVNTLAHNEKLSLDNLIINYTSFHDGDNSYASYAIVF